MCLPEEVVLVCVSLSCERIAADAMELLDGLDVAFSNTDTFGMEPLLAALTLQHIGVQIEKSDSTNAETVWILNIVLDFFLHLLVFAVLFVLWLSSASR